VSEAYSEFIAAVFRKLFIRVLSCLCYAISISRQPREMALGFYKRLNVVILLSLTMRKDGLLMLGYYSMNARSSTRLARFALTGSIARAY
ncbi:MAG TPA: hypothetical protein VFN95_01295, partial [Flavitalea sp.]|nr:hypothetical protein [Flavitalea sp.]